MKYLRKFNEELQHSTYSSAADKLKSHGQRDRADKMISHSIGNQTQQIKKMSFDILVGPKEFKNAKFEKAQTLRESGSKGVTLIFSSGENNTHRILASVKENGDVVWRDGNKFSNRKSVNDFQKALRSLASFQSDIKKMIEEIGLTPDSLNVVTRTFYD